MIIWDETIWIELPVIKEWRFFSTSNYIKLLFKYRPMLKDLSVLLKLNKILSPDAVRRNVRNYDVLVEVYI